PRGALPSGAIAFTVSNAANLEAFCTLNGSSASPCLTGDGGGSVEYHDLDPGLHLLSVERRSQSGASVRRAEHTLEIVEPDVVVFAATPGGIAAAIAAAESSKTVALLEPSAWVGGMMSGGLAKTDIGPRGNEIIGGWATKFFDRV